MSEPIVEQGARAALRASQIAGYLKLTSAHYHANMGAGGPFMPLRMQLAGEMDYETFMIAEQLKNALGGWYTGEVQR